MLATNGGRLTAVCGGVNKLSLRVVEKLAEAWWNVEYMFTFFFEKMLFSLEKV